MIKNIIYRAFVATVLSIGVGSALADDIDIYSMNTSATVDAPNVLIVMDNTANWSQSFAGSTKFAAELTALSQVVSALKAQFNLGLMMFTETGSPNNNTDGGYVRFRIQGMTDSSGNATDARNCLLKMVGSGGTCTSSNPYYSLLDIGADKSNGGKVGLTMGEVYDYFAGAPVLAYAGNNKVKADPLAFTSGAITGTTYKSPVSLTCQRNYVIVINNGPFADNSSDTATATSQLSASGGDTTVINPPDNGSSNNNESDEWTRFINKVSTVAAVTYTLEVGPSTSGQGPYNTSLLQSMGRQGQGGYYSAVDSTTLLAALTRIFNDINAKNSVFASASLPLSSDNSGAFLNQVYMGVFRPDAGGGPRWLGNLKQYQFAVDANKNLYLADALGIVAAGSTGFAQPDAVSFWTSKDTTKAPDAPSAPVTTNPPTDGSTGGFWYFDSKGSGGNYDSADGEWVEKGGAAQQLRLSYLGYGGRGGIGATNASTLNSLPARQVYTCAGGCATGGALLSATPFDTTNTAITDALLGTASVSVTAIYSAASKTLSSIVAGSPIAISHITNLSGKTIEVTTATNHGYTTGDSVTIAGTTTYDGPWSVTVTGVTTYTFTKPTGSTPNINPAVAGSVSYKNVPVATADTGLAHGFVKDQRVTIAGAAPSGFNGVVTIVTVPDTTHFTYALTTALGGPATTPGTVTSNTATATATAHGLTTGDSATIAGASPAGYNGVYVVTVIDANTFTYSYPTAAPLTTPSTTSATGTKTASVGGGRTTLIGWVRGIDTQNENGFQVNGADTDVRASIHGDVLHSRPIVLNYSASSTSNNVYLFYGGNDGVFRAIKGGQATTDGKEQWAFIPPEFFGQLKRQYNGSPGVKYPSTPAGLSPTPTQRDYFFDGPVGSYVERDSTGSVTKAYLYIAMRRGGRFIYALDVTSPTAPKFLWKKSSSDAGFAELGQTWSQPYVAKIHASANPVLIFGAGYDAASEDTDTPASVDTMGRAIYVVDAVTGAPLWAAGNPTTFGTVPSGMTFMAMDGRAATTTPPAPARDVMNFSFAADLLVMDRTQDGFSDRVYANDVGGNVWRVDIDNATPGNWTVSKIAALAARSSSNPTAARKLMFGPDVVFGATFDAIIIGTGDREHPLAKTLQGSPAVPTLTATQSVANRFYMIKDTNLGTTGAPLGFTDTCGATVSTSCSSFFDASSGGSVPTSANGWSVNLATGEKVVNGPLVTAGNVIFGTNQPDTSNTSCSPNLGIARRYDVNYLTGLGAGAFKDASGNTLSSQIAIGGGFLPSPVTGVVEIGGTPYLFTTDNPLNPGGVIPITVNVTQKRFRTYWKEKVDTP